MTFQCSLMHTSCECYKCKCQTLLGCIHLAWRYNLHSTTQLGKVVAYIAHLYDSSSHISIKQKGGHAEDHFQTKRARGSRQHMAATGRGTVGCKARSQSVLTAVNLREAGLVLRLVVEDHGALAPGVVDSLYLGKVHHAVVPLDQHQVGHLEGELLPRREDNLAGLFAIPITTRHHVTPVSVRRRRPGDRS